MLAAVLAYSEFYNVRVLCQALSGLVCFPNKNIITN